MTEDYLIQEFHEAGIWLPEELECIAEQDREDARQIKLNTQRLNEQVKLEQGFAYQVQALRNNPRFIDHHLGEQLPPVFPGRMIPVHPPRGFLAGLIGGAAGILGRSLPK